MNLELKKEDWGRFFDSLSKRRYECMTEVEVLNTEMGNQTLSNGLPLNGITVENVDDRMSIYVSVGETTGHHQTHNIVNPTRVAFLAGDNSHGDVVDIEEEDGTKTLIRFTEPMDILFGFTEYEVQVAAV